MPDDRDDDTYAKAMVDSNRARDAYVNKEQDKFFHCINQQ